MVFLEPPSVPNMESADQHTLARPGHDCTRYRSIQQYVRMRDGSNNPKQLRAWILDVPRLIGSPEFTPIPAASGYENVVKNFAVMRVHVHT